MWNIENSDITYGTNQIKITKDTSIVGKTAIFLFKNNSKSKIDFTIENNSISFSFSISECAKYQIVLKEKNETITFPLNLQIVDNIKEEITLTPKLSYLKGILSLSLEIKNIKSTHRLEITGDINKTIDVNRSKSVHTFHYLINDYKVINYRINNVLYSQMVIDFEKFPSKLAKISNGIKFNKASKYDLLIDIEDAQHLVLAGQTEFTYIWNGEKTFKVYLNGYEIFEQSIKRNNYLPELILVSDPLRVKIGSPSLKNIEVYIKGYDKFFILEAGETELPLNLVLEPGYRNIEIEKVSNATLIKNIYTFLIK